MGKRRLVVLTAVVVALVVALVIGLTVSGSSTKSGHGSAVPGSGASTATNVVFVHGSGCGALRYTLTAIRDIEATTRRAASTLHTVSYYSCDSGGTSIMDEGSASYLRSAGGTGTDVTIPRISYELAWYLWNEFGSKDEPVDLVGHSMGGIVIAYALQQIAAHDPNYPKSLTVGSVTTFSSPFGGVSRSLCDAGNSVECTELLQGSSLVKQIDAAGAVTLGSKTVWTIVGSEGADEIPTKSSLALSGVTYRVDYLSPAYSHTGYLTDTSTVHNARGTLNDAAFTNGAHSLALLATLLT